jgi:hypothetical protein
VKTTAERSIEALTWASVVIWLGFTLIMNLLAYAWLVVMVLAIIVLSSAIYQRSRGWQTSLSIWVFGIWMAVFSVIDAVNSLIGALNNGAKLHVGLDVYLGIALVSMGVASALRFVQGSVFGGGAAAGPRGTAQRAYTGDSRPNAPRLLNEEDYSTGYSPPSGGTRTGRTYGRAPIQEQRAQLDQPIDYGYNQSPQPDEAGGYAYEQPEPYDPQGRQDVYEQQPPQGLPSRGYRTGQPAQYDPQGRQDVYEQQPPQSPPPRGYRYDQPAQYDPQGRQDVYEQQPPQSPPPRGYRYDQPAQYDPQGRQDVYEQQPPQSPPPRGYRTGQPAQDDSQGQYGYDQAAPPQNQGNYTPPRAPRQAPDRRRVAPQRRLGAQPAQTPSDLESRVEDIIRRSRERRNTPPDNLPY